MNIVRLVTIVMLVLLCTGCAIFTRVKTTDTVQLPFLKNSAEECYYLDEFMPLPNRMVTGQSGTMGLRYYSYNAAHYKDWRNNRIVLAFYSRDERCWSLFEEYLIVD